jgi:crAss001_48 related protein
MSTPKQRVVEERSDLLVRVAKLRAFMGTAPFLALDSRQRVLLADQADVMDQYLKILWERLTLMKDP